MNQRDNGKHHSLIPCGKVVQKLLDFISLLFHIVGNHSRKILIGILTALPVCYVRFHTEQDSFNLTHRLVGGNGDNINRHHQIAVQVGKLRQHIVLDIGSVIFQKNNPCVFLTEFQIIAVLFNAVRADIVLEIVSPAHHFFGVKAKSGFLARTVEVVKNPQLFGGVQFGTL